jgi:ribosomal protein S18 acetylase RimI-like enzyme
MTCLRAYRDVWLSACLGLPCFDAGKQGQDVLDDVITKNDAVFITSKLPEGTTHMQRSLEALGFVRINRQLTFQWRPSQKNPTASSDKIRFITCSAQELGSSLADFAPLFETDRFHSDTRLPRDWSVRIKTQWITTPDKEKQVIVARIGADLAGFLTLQQRDGHVVIDLIAVAPLYQGRRIGLQLLSHLQSTVCKHQEIMVGTQHDNLAARRLYAAARFECVETKQVYHYYSKGRS